MKVADPKIRGGRISESFTTGGGIIAELHPPKETRMTSEARCSVAVQVFDRLVEKRFENGYDKTDTRGTQIR